MTDAAAAVEAAKKALAEAEAALAAEKTEKTEKAESVETSGPLDAAGIERIRAGYAFDNLLVYGTVGGLVGQGEMKNNGTSTTRTHVGYQVGAGLEAALTTNITARAEYLYTGTNERDYGAAGGNGDLSGNAVRVGVGYKF